MFGEVEWRMACRGHGVERLGIEIILDGAVPVHCSSRGSKLLYRVQ